MMPKTCDVKGCRVRKLRRINLRNYDFAYVCAEHELLLWRKGVIPLKLNKVVD